MRARLSLSIPLHGLLYRPADAYEADELRHAFDAPSLDVFRPLFYRLQ